MAKKVKGIFIDTDNNEISVIKASTKLEDIYSLLKCSCIDIPTRIFNGVVLDIYCDDEALLYDNLPPVAILTQDGDHKKIIETIRGNVFICAHTQQGTMKSLTNDEIEKVLLKGCQIWDKNLGDWRRCLLCEC